MSISKEVFPTVWLIFSALSFFALEEIPYVLNIMLGYVYLVFPALIILYTLAIGGVHFPVVVDIIKKRGNMLYWEMPFTMMVCAVFYHLDEYVAACLTMAVTAVGTVAYRGVKDLG